ncbi:alpha/beta hydrolase [Oceanicola sp. S124]|uniref:alpha/beta hydrolase n=1 Tax=Oceanicola sp. S124 TaxID=1042378 RepID=UPI0002557E90|nr:alpha/beta hydrolase [Oceanicola sp. S124]
MLAFLIATGRPHRRERLCELLWDLPDDPKAALRWALSKLRRVVDGDEAPRILADRERVEFRPLDCRIDLAQIHAVLAGPEAEDRPDVLEPLARALGQLFLDGLDGAGDESFDAWLRAEREDVLAARSAVLRRLVSAPATPRLAREKWLRLWHDLDPEASAEWQRSAAAQSLREVLPADEPAREPVPAAGGRLRPASVEGHLGRGRELARLDRARARALRAQRIGFCDVADGTKIAYATIGEGRPILKAANWLNHLEFDWASPIWGRSFAAIARNRTFIRYDERGCGLSDWGCGDLSFDAFVEDLEAVADKLGLEKFPLIGISQGAAVCIEYAVRHPERVTGLVLLGGYAAGWRHLASAEEQARREAVLTLTELGWGTDNPAYRHIFSQTFMPEASAADLAWFDDFQRQTTSPSNAARFQEAFGRIDVRHRLREVRVPTLVLHSRHDQRIPLETGRELAAGIPDAHFVPLESRNHILMDREPAWRDAIEAGVRFFQEKRL